MSKRVAIVVINQNGKPLLADCFSSLARHAPPYATLCLLDNGSSDGSVEWIRAHYPEVQVIGFSENQGFAGGYNQAIAQCDHEFIYLLNNDTQVTEHWLEPLVALMDAQADVGIGASRLLNFYDPQRIDHAGGLLSISGGGVDIEKGERIDSVTSAKPFETGFGCGAGFLVRRQLYQAWGGFDPAYIIYHEDVDLGWKCWLNGFRVLHVPQSTVLHKGSASMGHFEKPHRVYLAQYNRWANLIKNASLLTVLQGSVLSVGFDIMRSIKWTAQLKWSAIAALWRSNVRVVMHLNNLRKQRQWVKAHLVKVDRRHIERRTDLFAGFRQSLRAYLKL